MIRLPLAPSTERRLAVPLIGWVLLGLTAPYLFFFIQPIFFAPDGVMQFPEYAPATKFIGTDFRSTRAAAQAWFTTRETPYINNNQYAYPPLTMALFAPFTLLTWEQGYPLMVALTVACAVVVGLLLPLHLSRGRPISPLLPVAFLTGLFSYGFQFELERGQHNLIAVTLAVLAVWVFHTQPRYRFVGYGLFVLAVQLKAYPAIFVLLLIDDWRAWRANLRRIGALGLINVALLFVFGPQLFREFLAALADASANPYAWQGNHSIRAFSLWFPNIPGWMPLGPYSRQIQAGLLAAVGLSLGALVLQAYRQRRRGLQPMLFLACTVGALTIPGASHDYTLSYLVAPIALLFALPEQWAVAHTRPRRAVVAALMVLFCAAYGTTLASYATKPIQWHNNAPTLVFMLLVGVALAFVAPPPNAGPTGPAEPAPMAPSPA